MTFKFKSIIKYILPDAVPILHRANDGIQRNMLVLLFGWGGSKRRNLNKIINYYNSKGVNVISTTMPLGVPKFIRTNIEDLISNTLSEHRVQYPNASLNIHSFSNNGIWVYGSLIRRNIIPHPNKIIIDSAPYLVYEPVSMYLEAQIYSRVITPILLRRNEYYHPILSPLFTGLFTITNGVIKLIQMSNNTIFEDFIELNKFIRDKTPVVDTLFIYSQGDQLIPSKYIKQYIELLRIRYSRENNNKKNNNIIILDREFQDGDVGHVASFYVRSNVYKQYIDDFLFKDYHIK